MNLLELLDYDFFVDMIADEMISFSDLVTMSKLNSEFRRVLFSTNFWNKLRAKLKINGVDDPIQACWKHLTYAVTIRAEIYGASEKTIKFQTRNLGTIASYRRIVDDAMRISDYGEVDIYVSHRSTLIELPDAPNVLTGSKEELPSNMMVLGEHVQAGGVGCYIRREYVREHCVYLGNSLREIENLLGLIKFVEPNYVEVLIYTKVNARLTESSMVLNNNVGPTNWRQSTSVLDGTNWLDSDVQLSPTEYK